MRKPLFIITLALGLLTCAVGCSGGLITIDPIATSIIIQINSSKETNSQQLWGFWDVAFDPQAGRFDVTPLRGAAFQANVTKFLQPPASPIHLITVAVDAGESDFPAGLVVCDVTIRHPFMGIAKWRGFDVRGTVMGNATTAGMGDSGERWPSLNELRVLNADGYTRWWNPTEFTTFNKIFGYTEGSKAPAGFYASGTINGYKYFADGLGPEAPLSSMDLSQRGSFSTDPGLNTRRYQLQFPLSGGKPDLRFNYAVTASYSAPIDDTDPTYPVESYPMEANCAEAFRVDVTDNGSTAYYQSPTIYGGDLNFKLEVFDWGLGTASSVKDEIKSISFESPSLFDGQYGIAQFYMEKPGSSKYSRIIEMFIPDVHPTSVYGQEILIRVVSAHPTDYAPDLPGVSGFDFPEGAPLAAYALWEAEIASTGPQNNNPPEVGVVDGPSSVLEGEIGDYTLSYATDVEDGTNLTILWDNDGDMDFADDTDGNDKDLGGSLLFLTKGKYEVIARAVDSGGLFTDSAPFIVSAGGCPTEIHNDFDGHELDDAPIENFSRMDTAFQTVGPYAGQCLIQTNEGEVRRYDVSQPDDWTGTPYITLTHNQSFDFVYEMDVEDYSGRVILSTMNKDPTFEPGWFDVFDNSGAFLTSISVGQGKYISAFDTDVNGDLWVATWDGVYDKSWLQHYVYQADDPYYVEDPADALDTTEQFNAQAQVWDIAISYALDRIYMFRGNYNNGIAKFGEIYTYDMAPDGTLTYDPTIQMLQVFPGEVWGSYNNWYGVLVDGKIDIDHANEKTEDCRLVAMAQANIGVSGHYFQVMDGDLNVIDTKFVPANVRRYAFSIGFDPEPANRPIVTSGYNSNAEVQLAPAPPGY